MRWAAFVDDAEMPIVNASQARVARPAAFVERTERSRQNLLHNLAMHVGQAIVTALEAERESCVVEAQLVQKRGMQIVEEQRVPKRRQVSP